MKWLVVCSIGIAVLSLSACSLAADVTPPPVMKNIQAESSQAEKAAEVEVTPEPDAITQTEATLPGVSDDASVLSETPGAFPPEATGVITGTVTNASGGEIPSGIEILLHGFDQMQMVLTETARLADDGTFLFDPVPMKPGRAFIASLEFEGISYASTIAVAEEGQKSLQLPMEIFESTVDPSALTIDRLHIFFEAVDEKTIRVIELYVISNAGEKAVVAPSQEQPVLEIALPQDAAELEFREGEMGMRFVPTPDGFGDLAVIRPGMASHQVVFKYDLPFNRKLVFGHPVHLPVNAVVVLVPEDSLKVKGDILQDAGTRDSDGFTYRTYNGSELKSGAELVMEVSQRSSISKPVLSSDSSSTLLIGLAVLALTLIGAGAWLYSRSQKTKPAVDSAVQTRASEIEDTQDSLMDAILALDDQFKDGKIPEDAYLRRRAELKDRLSKLIA
jgi:hypothetical protein